MAGIPLAVQSNPYAAPVNVDAFEVRANRSLLWTLFLMVQVVYYLGFTLLGAVVGLSLLIGEMAGRPDEIFLSASMLIAAPIAGWFAVMEIPSLRSPIPGREPLLARFAVLMTLAPLGMSAFWAYEYLAFGHFGANVIPAIVALVFAVLWFFIARFRLRNSRNVTSSF